mmetsp:Transcript_13259/g.35981  ORF Transcript_13259/g.35981 Transcript_13259/m.35981 type:complete len:211 (+) Transcript_13259:246-878(+)
MLNKARFEAVGELISIQIFANEHQLVHARLAGGPRPARPILAAAELQEHVDALEHVLVVCSMEGQNAFAAEQVRATLLQQRGQPFIQLLHVALSLHLNAHAGDTVIMLMAMCMSMGAAVITLVAIFSMGLVLMVVVVVMPMLMLVHLLLLSQKLRVFLQPAVQAEGTDTQQACQVYIAAFALNDFCSCIDVVDATAHVCLLLVLHKVDLI